MLSPELDGTYEITSTSSHEGKEGPKRKSDGVTEIRNGETSRFDDDGVLWHSTFTILSSNEVKMISTADPGETEGNVVLKQQDGSPATSAVTYETVLDLIREGGYVQMSGKIQHGEETVSLTMRKIGK